MGVRGSEIWNHGKMAVALTEQAKDAMLLEGVGYLKSSAVAAKAF